MKTRDVTRAVRERLRLFRSFLAHPREVGAVLPTSRVTVRRMLGLADIHGADVVVELGAGTGAFTTEIVRQLGTDAELLAFEIDQSLVEILNVRFDDDPRVRVVGESAELLTQHLDGRRADVMISVLPLTTLPATVRESVMRQIVDSLAPDGVLLVIQYSTMRRHELEQAFESVEYRLSPVNVPPAFLFACKGPRRELASV